MTPYVLAWLSLLVRWFHVTAGIAWIGTSFYFVWLDDNLAAVHDERERERGVSGELWSVHGGGFYHNRKYLTGPRGEPLSADLHWFAWEAYLTLISGVAMLAVVYWAAAGAFLVDPAVMRLSPGAAIAISIASLAIGWFVYDGLCRMLEKRPPLLAPAVGAFLLFADWALFHLFSGRAAFVHVGSMIGTIMAANVFFVIIPGQRRMVEAIRAGRAPDPHAGALGKIRSVHNTYLTLPVLFTMISSHYPMTYGGREGWIVLAMLALAGVLVRRAFILSHARHGGRVALALPAAALVLIAAAAVVTAPRAQRAAAAPPFARVQRIVSQRCAECHAEHPTQPGFAAAPAGVLLDTPSRIVANAQRIRQQAVATRAMPLGNITRMTDDERAALGAWVAAGAPH